MKVYIRPKFTESVQGRNRYNIVNGRREGTTKAPGGTTTICIADRGDGQLNIGFDEKVRNPWFQSPEKLPSRWRNSGVEKLEEISKQTYFEIKHNVEENYYNPKAYVVRRNNKEPRTFLQTIKLVLQDKMTTMDLTDPVHELFYEHFKYSTLVAPSRDEADKNPNARFYVHNAEEEEDVKISRTEMIEAAIANWFNFKNTNPGADKLYDFAILVDESIKGRMSNTAIKTKMNDFITKEGKYLNMVLTDRVKKFNSVYEMATSKNKSDKVRYNALVFLQKLINHRILSDYQSTYRWTTKVNTNLEVLGRSKEEVVDWIIDPANSKYVDELKQELTERI